MRNCVIMVTTASCKTISEDPETVDLVLQRRFLHLVTFGQFLAGNRFAEGKTTKLSSAWAGRHEEVLKGPFLRTVVVILATRTLETECPPQGGNAAEASPVEGCPPRQAAGCLPEGNRQATGHFQKHGQEVRRLACSAHQPDSQTEYPISKSAQFQRTFSLSTWPDILTGQRQR